MSSAARSDAWSDAPARAIAVSYGQPKSVHSSAARSRLAVEHPPVRLRYLSPVGRGKPGAAQPGRDPPAEASR